MTQNELQVEKLDEKEFGALRVNNEVISLTFRLVKIVNSNVTKRHRLKFRTKMCTSSITRTSPIRSWRKVNGVFGRITSPYAGSQSRTVQFGLH